MAQNFGPLQTINVTSGTTKQVAHVTMPDGARITLSIEQPGDGSGAYLVVRGEVEIEMRPIASNTIGVRCVR